ncbi:MAG TPA: glycosyltransferase family 9 protein [Bryobacteraceae bacterium]|nr:glycosyltransferase family 9 protein [Bryobacteraceae bacterium]
MTDRFSSRSGHAEQILSACLSGQPWPAAALDALIAADDPSLFSVVAEGLSDRFEPALVDRYADIFSRVIAAVRPEHDASALRDRYERVRRPRRFTGPEPHTIAVLSRITLGADVAVTSVILDALKRRFPEAAILFVAPRKSYELFASDERIAHLAILYGGSLADRLHAPWFDDPGMIVVDPDSRITQLGLLPVCPEERYYFFESRAYGANGSEPLGALAARWAEETFGTAHARAYIAPADAPAAFNAIAVSLGVGENPAKRIGGEFERDLLRHLCATGLPVVIDSGFASEEVERVRVAAEGTSARILHGSFAQFAATVAHARLYLGYDSAGQHVAAASGVSLVSVFTGYPCERFAERWRPAGRGPVAIARNLDEALAAIERLL